MEGLGITCGQLRREVGRYLGFDRNPANWNANETQDVWDVIDSGLRQFYRPPRIEGEVMSHQWSFLRPQLTIQIEADKDDYELPEDFAGLIDKLYYVSDDSAICPIQIVNEGRILQLRQATLYNTNHSDPRYAAITPLKSDSIHQQRYRLMIWPRPDASRTLRANYYARQSAMRDDNAVPLGASEHAQAILASCLAAAESHLDDDPGGRKWQEFMVQVKASMDFDRRVNAASLGYNGDKSSSYEEPGYIRSSRLTIYEKYPE